jgi:hypothetical protein
MVRHFPHRNFTKSGLPVYIGEFLIDKYEVTNQQFQQFVDAGGYENASYWRQPFVRDGQVVEFDDAVQSFLDQDGQRRGPATWRNGRFPAGEENYPVRGVSWYEAAAYAAFAGKDLPTLFHWECAADLEETGYTIRLSNFSGVGPAAVGTYRGLGQRDTRDMAGNVKEWCWNEMGEGRRCIRGGAWNEPGYMFCDLDAASPWERKETYGLRCVKYVDPPETLALQPWIPPPQPPAKTRQPLESLRVWYGYDKTLPLNPRIVQHDDGKARSHRHEIVRIDAAYNRERFDLHLHVPRGDLRRHETIVFFPGSDAWYSKSINDHSSFDWGLIMELINTGRIVCQPIYKGSFERGDGTLPQGTRVRDRELWLATFKDGMRAVDYLTTRDDVDSERLIYVGCSMGATLAPISLALEPRFRAAVLLVGGYWWGPIRPELDP